MSVRSRRTLCFRGLAQAVITGPLFADDYLTACTLNTGASAGVLTVISELNVGNQLTVRGPGDKQLDFVPGPAHSSSVPVGPAVNSPGQLPPPFFSAGQWLASASGNSSVQPCMATLSIPSPIQITNYDQAKTIDHTKDLTITWDPTTYSDADFVNVQLYGQLPSQWCQGPRPVFCRVPAADGTSTIPAAMLNSFQPATGSLSLSIERKPRHRGNVHSRTERWHLDPGRFPISLGRMDLPAV